MEREFIVNCPHCKMPILIKENESMNLIGKSTIENLDERHLLDCIQIVKYLPQHGKSLMDIGTGAGLPGIILSIIGFKNLHLVEKSTKKALFLSFVSQVLAITC